MKGSLRSGFFCFLPIALLATALAVNADGTGETSAFLYIPGVHGDSREPAHRNWIEILSCDWGSVPPPRGSMVASSGKGPAGKLCFDDFSILKPVDGSSKVLADYCSRGVQFSHVRLELTGSTLGEFRYLVLRKVKILSVRPGRTMEDGTGTEIVTIGFRQVEYQ